MKSMLVIGAGRFGENLAKRLTKIGCEVLLVDKDENQINSMLRTATPYYILRYKG